VRFLNDFPCLKKSRLHGFARKFIEELLDIRAISEKSEVKIECNSYCSFATAQNSLNNKQTRIHEYGGISLNIYYVKNCKHVKKTFVS
jgi:hypothetical protein